MSHFPVIFLNSKLPSDSVWQALIQTEQLKNELERQAERLGKELAAQQEKRAFEKEAMKKEFTAEREDMRSKVLHSVCWLLRGRRAWGNVPDGSGAAILDCTLYFKIL